MSEDGGRLGQRLKGDVLRDLGHHGREPFPLHDEPRGAGLIHTASSTATSKGCERASSDTPGPDYQGLFVLRRKHSSNPAACQMMSKTGMSATFTSSPGSSMMI